MQDQDDPWAEFNPAPVPPAGGPIVSPQGTPTDRRIDEAQADKAEADAAAARASTAHTVRESTLPVLTDAQKVVDKEFASEYVKWTTGGGRGDFEKARKQLGDSLMILDSENVTGPVLGVLPDWLKSVFNPKSVESEENVSEVTQRNLRAILGGQFAAREGEALIKRAYNPSLPEEVNRKRVVRLLESMVQAAQAKEDAARYYEENGTLAGWKGSLPTMADFEAIDFESIGREPDDGKVSAAGGEIDAPPPLMGPFQNAEGRIAGAGPQPEGAEIATGKTAREDDPDLVAKGVQQEYLKRLARGDTYGDILAWAREVGIDERAFPSIGEQVKYRRAHPEVPLDQYDVQQLDDRVIQVSEGARRLGDIALSGPGAYAIGAGDAATGFNLDSLTDNPEQARAAMDQITTERPYSSMAGTVTGGTLTALAGQGALGAAGVTGLRAAMGADAGYGVLAGMGGTDYSAEGNPAALMDRITGGLQGGVAGLAGGYLGARTARALGQGGVSSPYVQTLQQADVPLTLGQQLSQSGRGTIKGIEDRLSGLPIVGNMINARRAEGLEIWNSKTFDEALKPIGKDVGGEVGESAVVRARGLVSEAYDKALKGKFAPVDQALEDDLTKAATQIFDLPRVNEEVANSVGLILEPYMSGQRVTGEAMQQISRELRDLAGRYSTDPLGNRIRDALYGVEDAIFGLFKRNAPEVVPDYNKAKAAARRLFIVEDAVNKAKNTEGQFTPAQLGMAERTSVSRYEGRSAAASGQGPLHDWQRAAQEVLPSKVPDSGTAGRLILPAILAAAGGATGYATGDGAGDAQSGAMQGLTIGAVLSLAYSRAAQRALTKPGRGLNSPAGRLAAKHLASPPVQKVIGAAAGSGAAISTLPDR